MTTGQAAQVAYSRAIRVRPAVQVALEPPASRVGMDKDQLKSVPEAASLGRDRRNVATVQAQSHGGRVRYVGEHDAIGRDQLADQARQ